MDCPRVARPWHQGHQPAALLAGQVQLRAQPAARAAQRVVGRFRQPAAGALTLNVPVPARPGGVLVRAHDRGVHRHLPGDQPGGIRPRLQRGDDQRPDPGALPGAKEPVHAAPGPVALGDIAPRRPDPHPPADPVDQRALRPDRRATALLARRQQRGEQRPLLVGQVETGAGGYRLHSRSPVAVAVFLVDDSPTGDLLRPSTATHRSDQTVTSTNTRRTNFLHTA